MPKQIVVYNRSQIMRRAGEIARERRADVARRAHDATMTVVAGRIVYTKPYAAFLAETPLDRSAALKQAWAEVKTGSRHAGDNRAALVLRRPGRHGLAPLRRRIGPARIWSALVRVGRWLNSRFIPSRAA